MNEYTTTVKLYYISLNTEKSKVEHVSPVYHKMASELFLVGGNGLRLLKREIEIRVDFGTGLVVQSILSSIHFVHAT
jgi:hypothetical protein